MLFELRQYRIQPGKRAEWVKLMEDVIIPFQISKGMVVIGSFTAEEDPDLYVWIRRFDSEEQRQQLYDAVYQSDTWKNEIAPQTATMNIREQMVITRLNPTPKSVIR